MVRCENSGKSGKEPDREGNNASCQSKTPEGGTGATKQDAISRHRNRKMKAGIEPTEHATVRREIGISPWDAWQEARGKALKVLWRKRIRGRKGS